MIHVEDHLPPSFLSHTITIIFDSTAISIFDSTAMGKEEAHCSGSRCQNDETNPTQMINLGGDNPPYVVPSVRAAATTGCGYEICYRDNRAGRPWMVESADPETGKIERGSVGELTYRLVPIKVTEVPNIPPPRNMVKAGDITCDMGMNKEEMVATLLNGYNVRHYIHKQKQQGGNAFVITIEFDARMIESPKTSKEATVCLTARSVRTVSAIHSLIARGGFICTQTLPMSTPKARRTSRRYW